MTLKKLIAVVATSALVVSCATGSSQSGGLNFRTVSATSDMGVQYLLGRGVQQNDEKAMYYFTQAANRGDPFAKNQLGYMYLAGKGAERNPEKAFKYYKEAAEDGVASAQYSVGLMYLRGIGTAKNKNKAIEWFQNSAEGQFEPAQIALKKYKA